MRRLLDPYLKKLLAAAFDRFVQSLPFAARAWNVRVDPKVQELATLMTEIKITALKIEGSALMPAS